MADSDLGAPATPGELVRTHPATIVVRTVTMLWQLAGAFIAFVFFGSVGGRRGAVTAIGLGAAATLIVGLVGASHWVGWAFFRYGVEGGHLLIHEGWLVRKRRAIPLARVQGVDIRADLLMRLLGVADVVVQTAGGGAGEPEAKIGAIRLADAESLRTELLHAGADLIENSTETLIGADPLGRMSDLRGVFGGVESAAVEQRAEFKLTPIRLGIAALTSRSVPVFLAAGLGGLAQLVEFVDDRLFETVTRTAAAFGIAGALLGGLVSVLAIATVAVAVAVARDFGFTVRRVADRLETEAGLLERRMTAMPVGRIQTVSIAQSPLRRWSGFASIEVVTAGFGRGEEQQSTTSSAIVPIARRHEIEGLMHALLPEALIFPETVSLPGRALRFYLLVPTALALGLAVLATVAAALLGPAALSGALASGLIFAAGTAAWRYAEWRQAAVGADARALAVRSGVLGAYRVRIPRTRIQTLSVRRNPFQRRAGLATLVIATVSGSSRAVYRVRHLADHDAERLMEWYATSAV